MEKNNRYKEIVNNFKNVFPEAREFHLYRAPGRVNLIGEHTDYNGFPVLPMAINQDIAICASLRNDNKVILRNTNPIFEPREFKIDFQIPSYPKGDWGNYCKAAFQTLQDYLIIQKKEKRLLYGMNVLVDGNIPIASGLSSSSALVVASAVVINDLNKLDIDNLSLAELLAVGEKYVGTEGGGMDQSTSLCGKEGNVLKIDFFPLRVEYIPFHGDYVIVVCNSLVDAKKTAEANIAYNQRVIECRLGAAMIKKYIEDKYKSKCEINLLADFKKLNFSYLLNNINKTLDEIFPKDNFTIEEISTILGIDQETLRERYFKLKSGAYFKPASSVFKIKKRLRHVFTEAERVEKSKIYIKDKMMTDFGELMYESHESCAKDYEVSCPELDLLVELAQKNGALGARLTGAGFGGCTVNLFKKENAERFIKSMIHNYYKNRLEKEEDFSNFIFICKPSNGAGKILLR